MTNTFDRRCGFAVTASVRIDMRLLPPWLAR